MSTPALFYATAVLVGLCLASTVTRDSIVLEDREC